MKIIVLSIISVNFRSIHWQGAENELNQGPCKMCHFGRKMIFMDLGCLGPLVVDLGRVFGAVAALPRNFIGLWCLYVAHRAGISGIALLEEKYYSPGVIFRSRGGKTIYDFWMVFRS